MSKSSGARPSFAHLADKFNTSAPTNYVAGRGRGISGFSKPEPDLPKRGGAAASSSSFAVLESDATDTRALDVDETERFESQELSMDNAQAGGAIEAFSMEAERREGQFDEAGNYVRSRRGEEEELDARDAWLKEMDGATTESAEQQAARRRKLQQEAKARQQALSEQKDSASPAEVAALLVQAVGLLQAGETVAVALRRLSGKPRAGAAAAGGGKRKRADEGDAEGAASRKQQFEELTDVADGLLRAGRFGIYSESREALEEEARANPLPPPSAGEAAAHAQTLGIDAQVHEGAVAGGFVFFPEQRVYYNAGSGLFFDPATSLYWTASATGGVGEKYFWDAAAGQFTPANQPA